MKAHLNAGQKFNFQEGKVAQVATAETCIARESEPTGQVDLRLATGWCSPSGVPGINSFCNICLRETIVLSQKTKTRRGKKPLNTYKKTSISRFSNINFRTILFSVSWLMVKLLFIELALRRIQSTSRNVCMSVRAIAKHPLPEVVEISGQMPPSIGILKDKICFGALP